MTFYAIRRFSESKPRLCKLLKDHTNHPNNLATSELFLAILHFAIALSSASHTVVLATAQLFPLL